MLGHVTDVLARAELIPENVAPGHLRPPGGGRQVAGKHSHRGGLPRAVGTEESDNLSLAHLEVDLVHRHNAAVALGELFDLDHLESCSV